MTVYWVRVFAYTLLPLLLAALLSQIGRSHTDRLRRSEIYLLYLLALGVAGSGIGGFFGHVFLSDQVAAAIGWPAGSPFQLEMGFCNLALGVLGLIAVGRRDGFREATVTAVTIVGLGATIVHLWDIVLTGNLAPGNTVQNISNLLRPALLIILLRANRRAERELAPDMAFDRWRLRHAQAAGWMTALVATGMSMGYAFDRPVWGVLAGVAAGGVALALTLRAGASGS